MARVSAFDFPLSSQRGVASSQLRALHLQRSHSINQVVKIVYLVAGREPGVSPPWHPARDRYVSDHNCYFNPFFFPSLLMGCGPRDGRIDTVARKAQSQPRGERSSATGESIQEPRTKMCKPLVQSSLKASLSV